MDSDTGGGGAREVSSEVQCPSDPAKSAGERSSSSRRAKLEEDLAVARRHFLLGGADSPKFVKLDLEDDSVCFGLTGFDEEFTAFPSDEYPRGTTTVVGPNELEFALEGTIEEILLQVQMRTAKVPRLEKASSMSDSSMSMLSHDSVRHLALDEAQMEPLLSQDIACVRELCGAAADAVHVGHVVDNWRLRIRVDTVVDGVPVLDDTTAEVWGLHPRSPIRVDIIVPAVGYLDRGKMPESIASAVFQEGFPEFMVEKQLITIINAFYSWSMGFTGGDARASSSMRQDDAAFNQNDVVQSYDAKKVMMYSEASDSVGFGFLGPLVKYLQLRLRGLHEYCAICDRPFQYEPLYLRTVCSRRLCSYQLAVFGSKITTADGPTAQCEVVDLLFGMLTQAAHSDRHELICTPYPCVYLESQDPGVLFHPDKKEFSKLQQTLQDLLVVREEAGARYGAAWTTRTPAMSTEGAALMQWVLSSNRSYLRPLADDQRLAAYATPYQYLLISAPPERESRFQQMKRKHGSLFAYHGSPAENWHSILRNGLKNASNTALMMHGAAHGSGIYLALDSQTSFSYGAGTHPFHAASATVGAGPRPCRGGLAKAAATGNRLVDFGDKTVMLAICEVIDHPSLQRKRGAVDQGIWVAPNEETVITRFFLLFPDRLAQRNVRIKSGEDEIKRCMAELGVGAGPCCA